MAPVVNEIFIAREFGQGSSGFKFWKSNQFRDHIFDSMKSSQPQICEKQGMERKQRFAFESETYINQNLETTWSARSSMSIKPSKKYPLLNLGSGDTE